MLSLGGDAGANHIENLSGDSDGLQTVGVRRFIQVGRIPTFDRPAGQLGKLDRYEGIAFAVGEALCQAVEIVKLRRIYVAQNEQGLECLLGGLVRPYARATGNHIEVSCCVLGES